MMNNKFNSLIILFAISFISNLNAFDDYRCTDNILCEIDDISKLHKNGKYEANLRLAYINSTDSSGRKYATSIGGIFGYETASYKGVSAKASAYISQKVAFLTGKKDRLNGDFFNSKGDSFAYIGEAYINYYNKGFNIRVGRQKLDTPLNDRDDIRMLPNSFEAVTAGYGGFSDSVIMAGYVKRWAGFDSSDDISKFKEIPGYISSNGKKGEHMLEFGFMSNYVKDIDFQIWYYIFDKLSNVLYEDINYNYKISDNSEFNIALQFAKYNEKSSSGADGTVYGLLLSGIYNRFNFETSINRVISKDDKTIFIGFGGGPYFTSMEETTIDSIPNVKSYRFSIGYELERLSLNFAFGHFDSTSDLSIEYLENDFIANYEFNKDLNLEISFADIKNRKNSSENFKRVLVRMNYNF